MVSSNTFFVFGDGYEIEEVVVRDDFFCFLKGLWIMKVGRRFGKGVTEVVGKGKRPE